MPKTDVDYMKRALRLARKGRGKTSPNPMVGAVIVKNGAVVGEGFHPGPGAPHAEVIALTQAGKRAKGATLYTNLEPCCHTEKRTPPCTDAILKSGLRRVVAAMTDPNPLVSGGGLEQLRKAGMEVTEGVLREEAERLNEVFIKYITTGKPFVILKAAMTLDGRIATAKGSSRWITGEAARLEVHHLRSEVDAVLVGIGTVLADDPMLTARRPGMRNPIRIVIDPDLKIPLKAKLVTSLSEAPTFLITTSSASAEKIRKLEKAGVQVALLPQANGEISFDDIFKRLGKAGITSVLIEGGGRVNGMALRAGVVDKVIFYVAPKLLCGDDARSAVAGKAIPGLGEALLLEEVQVREIGGDFRIEGYLKKKERGGRS
ncbi:MAG: bifunctional diaminohydroxyphosphoribosylaminopyrimidine deaminase/5-amino-6-(5-phosphoribosylamino)uracil reductase RibD [Candidatus Manganitrophus sp. SB1]|nr:bifunctional diaminohydroxyphosphoribosylaminopyrimidine deaminase/5-amino-6-(5-phosphoribosylamino)uracil reductase RibD [Candidatus Manganitrophus morganii]